MSIRVADLPLYQDALTGQESVLLEVSAGTRLVPYPRLWKPVVRQVVSVSTGVLAQGDQVQGVVTLGLVFEILKVQLSVAARLRLYSTAAARLMDVNRPYSTLAQAGSGLVLEVRSSGPLVQFLDPHAHGACFESSPTSFIPYAIQNLGASGLVSVTLTFIDRG